MPFDATLAELRFGCGCSPRVPPPASSDVMIASLERPDPVEARFAIPSYETFQVAFGPDLEARRVFRENKGTRKGEAARSAFQKTGRLYGRKQAIWLAHLVLRRASTQAPMRERLASFWADHFTVAGKHGLFRFGAAPYAESAIRPHVAGRFEDLLRAAVLHPMMLHYLDQKASAGPKSRRARRTGRPLGLNENLARELLELHTVGSAGGQTQSDIRELAELLTGATFNPETGFVFRPGLAEPGAEMVLGRQYGGGPAHLEDIEAMLVDLARHPKTAAHLSHKIARFFLGDDPDHDVVSAMTAAWLETAGSLPDVYRAMLDAPSAWDLQPGAVKLPLDFVASACRALSVEPVSGQPNWSLRTGRRLRRGLREMGHIWERPAGPDGLPEGDRSWITPQGLAARLVWAMTEPRQLAEVLPDPRGFVDTALGDRAGPELHFAAAAAETRWEGIGLVLSAPAFQRM